MISKFEQFEKEFDTLIEDAPLDYDYFFNSRSGKTVQKEFMIKVEKLKAFTRTLLEN